MEPSRLLALMFDPALIMEAMGRTPDPWQRNLLLSSERQILLNCSRQSGKSTTVAALALHTAFFQAGSLTLVLSPTQRQSHEFFRKVMEAYNALKRPIPPKTDAESQSSIELENGSRIIGLPGKEGSIRSFSGVTLLILDEAARIADDLYRSVRPMLAVSQGRLLALSTPFGQRGFFYDEWHQGQGFKKVKITWKDCPRITPSFLEEEKRSMGEAWVQQEYECLFTALEGLVYPDFENCLVSKLPYPAPLGRLVGGIDFGWRNPFAALWGVLDRDDVLWITHERYLRETPLHEHCKALQAHKGVMWYADPAGAVEIEELRAADLSVRKGDNNIRAGIQAVMARIRSGRLKIYAPACPSLISEAQLYRYPSAQEKKIAGENPVDDHNHALGALRYLISKLDHKFIARLRKTHKIDGPEETDVKEVVPTASPKAEKPWLSLDNEALWE
jgi:Terminase large subunit, T4likevirus-type, N-terminal/Terminase RNaseH-like domain